MDFSELWVDKYRPLSLDKMTYNSDLTIKLQKLAACDDLPHLIFYGPSGAGKKTRVVALLKEIYGNGVLKATKEIHSVKQRSKTFEIPILSSNYHIDFTPSDAKNRDKLFI